MASEVDLYDGHYGQLATDLLGDVRLETYGEDSRQMYRADKRAPKVAA
jgi:hypothetical protein